MKKQIGVVRLYNGAWGLRGDNIPKHLTLMLFLSWEAGFAYARTLDPNVYHVLKYKNLTFAA